MLTMAPGNILYTSFPNVLNFDAPMNARFSAIEAFFQYFNWERVNLLGFSTLNSYVSNFASFAYAREWLVGSNLVLDDASHDSLITAFSVMKETGTKWVTEIYLTRYTFFFQGVRIAVVFVDNADQMSNITMAASTANMTGAGWVWLLAFAEVSNTVNPS